MILGGLAKVAEVAVIAKVAAIDGVDGRKQGWIEGEGYLTVV